MKHMRKALALALALIMVLSLAVFANAAEGDIRISVTTSDSGASVAGHTYEVYQIFTGDVAEDGKTLSNVKFGENYKPEGKTVQEAMEEISPMNAAAAAEFLAGAVTGNAIAELNDENNYSIEVAPGYYLIVDVTEDLPENETSSAFILQVLEPMEIKSKHTTVPNVEKKIDDVNDSNTEEDEIEWHDSADHDIGDLIDFQITTTLPSAFQLFVDNKKPYPYTLHDKEEAGLTFQPDSVVVKIGNTVLTKDEDYTIASPAEDGHTFDIVFADLTKVEGAAVGAKIVVTYKSLLNEQAVLGSQGNVNKVYGEYKNYYDDDEPFLTPEDAVIAFTYKVVVNKVHPNGVNEEGKPVYEALAGAEFTLEKYNAATNAWVAIDQVEAEPGTVFTFNGLDDGNYRLTETLTPDGYNTIDPIEFTVAADHDIKWETQERTDVLTSLTGNVTTGEIEFTVDKTAGSLTSDVINESGVELPETGGIGTTIFYVIGGLLAGAAVVLLITKKRMSSAE